MDIPKSFLRKILKQLEKQRSSKDQKGSKWWHNINKETGRNNAL